MTRVLPVSCFDGLAPTISWTSLQNMVFQRTNMEHGVQDLVVDSVGNHFLLLFHPFQQSFSIVSSDLLVAAISRMIVVSILVLVENMSSAQNPCGWLYRIILPNNPIYWGWFHNPIEESALVPERACPWRQVHSTPAGDPDEDVGTTNLQHWSWTMT